MYTFVNLKHNFNGNIMIINQFEFCIIIIIIIIIKH